MSAADLDSAMGTAEMETQDDESFARAKRELERLRDCERALYGLLSAWPVKCEDDDCTRAAAYVDGPVGMDYRCLGHRRPSDVRMDGSEAIEEAERILGVYVPDETARCPVHGMERHGLEAEELRQGIEQIMTTMSDRSANRLQELLDKVDARDSLAFLDRQAERRAEPPKLTAEELLTRLSDPEFRAAFNGLVLKPTTGARRG